MPRKTTDTKKAGDVKPALTGAENLTKLERDRLILQLRRDGMSYDEISQDPRVGIGANSCYRVVKDWLDQTAAECTEAAHEIIQIESARLDKMLCILQFKIEEGNIGAIETALKIQERRARLHGLDKPEKVEQTVRFENMSDTELIQRARSKGIPIPPELLEAAKGMIDGANQISGAGAEKASGG